MSITRRLISFLAILGLASSAWAAPSNTMSITPSATAGQTITASDENSRNNEVSTKYNAHDHNDVDNSTQNTFTLGDGATGNKTYAVDDDQASSPAIRFNTDIDRWTLSNDGSTYQTIGLSSGSVIAGENDFRIGDNLGNANKQIIANEDSTDGVIRWNVSSDQWQLSNDASNFHSIGTLSGSLTVGGVREFNIGDGTDNFSILFARNADTAKPFIRYNTQTNVWEASNNGLSTAAYGIRQQSKVGSFSRDTSLASGTQSVTGVGFKGTRVIFMMAVDGTKEAGMGFSDGSSNRAISTDDGTVADTWTFNDGAAIDNKEGAGVRYEGTVSSFGDDGFTISWTKTGSPTGTMEIRYLVEG